MFNHCDRWKLGTVLVLLGLGACAQRPPEQWGKPDGTEAEFYQDQFDCQQRSAAMYPQALAQEMTSPGVNIPQDTQTSCVSSGGIINCRSGSAGGVSASVYNTPPTYQSYDANAGNRRGALRSCMMSKGYRPRPN